MAARLIPIIPRRIYAVQGEDLLCCDSSISMILLNASAMQDHERCSDCSSGENESVLEGDRKGRIGYSNLFSIHY